MGANRLPHLFYLFELDGFIVITATTAIITSASGVVAAASRSITARSITARSIAACA